MILNKAGKIFNKMNIFDFLFLLIIVFVIGIELKFGKAKIISFFIHPDNLNITIYMEEVSEYAVNAVKTGDVVVDSDTNSVFGNVNKLESGPSVCYTTDRNGQYKESAKPGYSSVYITIDGKGLYRDGEKKNGISIDNTEYFIGKSVTLKVGNTIMYGSIYNVDKE
jgi:hypothetical protein